MKEFQVVFDDDFKPIFNADNSIQLLSILANLIYPFFPAGIKHIKNKETGKTIPNFDFDPLVKELKVSRLRIQEAVMNSDEEVPRKPEKLPKHYHDIKEEAQNEDKSLLKLLLEKKKALREKFT